jgi:hypothetical protein
MAREHRRSIQKRLFYFFLNDKVHKIIKAHRAKDELIAWCYPDKKRVLYSYSQVEKYAETAYTVKQAAEILGKHKITIENYILKGKVKEPEKIYPIGNPESSWTQFMLRESDIMDLHEFIADVGYSKNLPSKAELRAILKHNLILYTKSSDGKFVPVWKAE